MIKFCNVGALLLGVCYRLARMTVEQTRKHILNIIAPNDSVFTKLGHIFFHKLKQGIEIILRIFQETEQKLDLAVASPRPIP